MLGFLVCSAPKEGGQPPHLPMPWCWNRHTLAAVSDLRQRLSLLCSQALWHAR